MPQVNVSFPQVSGGLGGVTGTIGATVSLAKAGAGQLYGWYIYNPNTSVEYLQLFDSVSAPVLGTTAPTWSFGIPLSGGANILGAFGLQFQRGIWFAFTTTRSGSSAPASTLDYNLFIR